MAVFDSDPCRHVSCRELVHTAGKARCGWVQQPCVAYITTCTKSLSVANSGVNSKHLLNEICMHVPVRQSERGRGAVVPLMPCDV